MSDRSNAPSKQAGRGAATKAGRAPQGKGSPPRAPAAGSGDERADASQPAERRPAELAKQQISRQPQKPSRTGY